MSKNTFVETQRVDIADGAQILNTTTETIICPDIVFAADDSRIYPGATWEIECFWDASFVITTPGTLILKLRWGGVAGTILAQTDAFAPDPTGAVSNASGYVRFLTTWRTIGSAGSAFSMGRFQITDFDDASATTLQGNLNMGVFGSAGKSTPAVVSSLDTTTSKNLSVTGKFSVNTSGTQLTNHLRVFKALN